MPKSVHFIRGAGDDAPGLRGLMRRSYAAAMNFSKWMKGHSKWAVKKGITIGWYIATATIITAMPLLFELQREVQVLEFEKLQVKDLLAQGYPPQELVRMGMTLEPSVLNP